MRKWTAMIPVGLIAAMVLAVIVAAGCSHSGSGNDDTSTGSYSASGVEQVYEMGTPGKDDTYVAQEGQQVIYLAGGCFWGMEELMASIDGVTDATSGYANGNIENPTYEQVCADNTGFRETVRVTYDPSEVSLETILYAYFLGIDPTTANRQGNDRGSQYQAGIYYNDEASMTIVEKVVNTEKSRYSPFNVEVGQLTCFYRAEDYHQDYLANNPGGYCGISPTVFDEVAQLSVDAADYSKPDDATIAAQLSPTQYDVTQNAATEPAFDNEYWDLDEKGIYVDVVTGEPLFLSTDKYASSCGWPAFDAAIDPNVLVERTDHSYGMSRTEILSRVGGSHLGHMFLDDPESPNGVHYCIDSAALRFIPYDQMDAEGYGEYKSPLD